MILGKEQAHGDGFLIPGFPWPIVFIGECKGVLTILFTSMAGQLQDRDDDNLAQIQVIAEDAGDDS
jgi:hypothetical protein